MKRYILPMMVLLLIAFITYQTFEIQVHDFESCVEKTGTVMESYPRQCIYSGITYIEDISVLCTEEQRDAQFCTADYAPVCATVLVQCITEPCDRVQQTFSNSCGACSNRLVGSYVPGECPS